MDEWIREGWRKDPHGTISKLLRLGIIAFEDPKETTHKDHLHRQDHSKKGVMCGRCVKYAVSDIRILTASIQFGGSYDYRSRVRPFLHFCRGQPCCEVCKRPMPEPLHIPTLDGQTHQGQPPGNILVDLPDA